LKNNGLLPFLSENKYGKTVLIVKGKGKAIPITGLDRP
jgi:hypothetical protein